MPFNDQGVYTRIDNSFSNPVAGTEIDPTDADTYFDDIDGALNAQLTDSTTSLTIGTGTKVWTIEPDKDFNAGRFVLAYENGNSANYMHGQVTAFSGTTLTVNVTSVGGSGTIADWILEISGPAGPTGAAATVTAGTTTTGAAGTNASVVNSGSSSAAVFDFTIPRGATPAIGFNFSTTTTDSDPGAGNIRFNNATPASVTFLYVDNQSAAGQTVTTWLDSFDDSTTTSPYGTITLTDTVTPSTQLQFNVADTVVDGTGYRKIPVTQVSGTTLPANGDMLGMTFSRSGNTGSGNISGSTGSTDNAILRADGTGGATLQSSSVTVDDSANMSGVAALSTTTIELGHASDTTLSRLFAGVVGIEGIAIATLTNQVALSNKRITPRVLATSGPGATPTINSDNYDAVDLTALATAITSMTTNLSGTPTNFQKLIIRFKDNGTARAIAWGAGYSANGVALPTTTVLSKLLTVGFIWNGSTWGCVASAQEA